MPIAAVAAVVGVGISGASAYMQYDAAKKNADAQQKQLEANQEHANLVNESNLKVQADNVKAVEAQQAVEGVSKQQMELDANRRMRQIIRQSVVARSTALSTETNQGVSAASGGSTYGGILGNIQGQTDVNLLGVSQNKQAGELIFGYHNDMLNAYKQAAIDGYVPATAQFPNGSGTEMALAQGLGSLGGGLVKSEGVIGKIGSYFGGSEAYGGGSALGGDAYGGSANNPLSGLDSSDYGAGF